MAKFVVNPHRFDPYSPMKFRVKIDNQYVAGLSKCSTLKRTTEVTQWREGGDPTSSRQLPGKTKWDPVTLEAGVTHDTTFETWANLVHNFQGDAAMSLKNFRKDIIIDVFNHAGQKVLSYKVFRCWVSEYDALPDLDAASNAVAIQRIKLENEGWERDVSVTEPAER
ncbi:MAG TPA: phage tail protein [Polyangiaceae bacterium]|jgi:phage tail-like protein|nr:phage tail protein [Polyangiaceae bacterium]